MKFGPFKEGIDILAKYIDADDISAMCAQHDILYVGGELLTDYAHGVISEEDVTRLKELGWFIDEESWACYT